MQTREVGLLHPAQHDVLLHREPDAVAHELARDICERSHLVRRDVPERQLNRGHCIPFLTLGPHVGSMPSAEGRGVLAVGRGLQRASLMEGLLVVVVELLEVRRPTGIVRKRSTLLVHQLPEFLDPELGDEELNAGPPPVVLLAESREDAAHRL